MTGTSLDGVDAAAVRITGRGLDMRGEFVAGASAPLGAETAAVLRKLGTQGVEATAGAIAAAAHGLASDHALAIRKVIAQAGKPDLIAIHGQTLYHRQGLNWQMMDCWGVSAEFRVPIVFDFRGADIARGGRGAPITPIADWVMFRGESVSRCIVNLGGFCNITHLPADGGVEMIRARDVCACNQVLDGVARAVLGAAFDGEGAAAMAGHHDEQATEALMRLLNAQHDEQRSLGTGDEGWAWIEHWRTRCTPQDLAASACAAIGSIIGQEARNADEVYLAGGGVRNAALVRTIGATAAPARMSTLDPLGVPGVYREAAAMAVLGALCADGVPITLEQVTGLRDSAPVAGAWIFPNGPREVS